MKKFFASAAALMLLLFGVIAPVPAKAATSDKVTYTIVVRNVYIKPVYEYTPEISYDDVYSYDVTLHYGINGWQNIQDLKMTKNLVWYNGAIVDVEYKAQVTVNKGDVIDFAYYVDRSSLNEESQWYNNNGSDYHVNEQSAPSKYFYVSC